MKYCRKTTIEQAAAILGKSAKTALFAHTRPDGDTIGASLALCLALRRMGKKADVFCDGELGEKFAFFEGTADISSRFEGGYDLYAAIDCGDIFRTGAFSGQYASFPNTLTVDHHGGEPYSAYNCLYDYSSTCQIVYEILKAMNFVPDGKIATFLYMGLCTDTGNFSHANTDAASFLMAADMCKLSADTEKVNRVFFKDISFAASKLLGKALSRIRSYHDGKIILLYVLKEDLDLFGLDDGATEGLVQYAVNVDSASVGISVCQYAENTYKVSMRGKDSNVRDICAEFGGGGHVRAAGCMVSGLFEDVVQKLVSAAERNL